MKKLLSILMVLVLMNLSTFAVAFADEDELDTTPPTVLSARSVMSGVVQVEFSENVIINTDDVDSAFSIESINGVSLGIKKAYVTSADSSIVAIWTLDQVHDLKYFLTVNSVITDESGNEFVGDESETFEFTGMNYASVFDSDDDDEDHDSDDDDEDHDSDDDELEDEEEVELEIEDEEGRKRIKFKYKRKRLNNRFEITSEVDAEDRFEREFQNFDDLEESFWGYKYIKKLYERGDVSGYENGNRFGVNDFVTRAELLKMAIRAFHGDVDTLIEDLELDDIDFEDVGENDWYSKFVRYAYWFNVVDGFEGKMFKPNQPVTRAAALKIIFRVAGISADEVRESLPDVDEGEWYAPFVSFALEHEFISGYDDGNFYGNRPLTRAQAAKVISLVLDYLGQDE